MSQSLLFKPVSRDLSLLPASARDVIFCKVPFRIETQSFVILLLLSLDSLSLIPLMFLEMCRFLFRRENIKIFLQQKAKGSKKCNNELEMCLRMYTSFLLCHSLQVDMFFFLSFCLSSVVVLFCFNIVWLAKRSRKSQN